MISPLLIGPSASFGTGMVALLTRYVAVGLLGPVFNSTLLEASRVKGNAFFKATEASALTKADLRALIEEKDDLVREIATFGSEFPTSPMFWKKQTTQLEWIVRQMSWTPPWTSTSMPHEEGRTATELVA